MPEFLEVADRVWVARHEWCDVNVTAIAGDDGLLVVDTLGSSAAGRELVAALDRLGVGEVTAVVNTHAHFDHRLGNGALREAYGEVPIHAHEAVLAEIESSPPTDDEALRDDPRRAEVADTLAVLPDRLFSSVSFVDLGGRFVELVHPGRGHTGADVVVRVPDADVVVAGDLVEESGPPSYGPDSYPLDWPVSLDLVAGLLTPGTVVVPGHGAVVDREFVAHQRAEIGVIAETVRDLVQRRVPQDQALAVAEWPFPRERLAHAVERGYAQLPELRRQLPLV
jgi:glyoxylase-like metal-dependent hydrolase (beta-lactamase superfamily II)